MTDYKASSLFDFSGASVVVVGGSKGLGAVLAEALIANGAGVLIAARNREDLQNQADHLNGIGPGQCDWTEVDLTEESSIQALATEAGRLFEGKVNVVINSAGINIRMPVKDIPLVDWETVQRTNITGAFLLSREMYPLLAASDWGRMINICSIFSSRSFTDRANYAANRPEPAILTMSGRFRPWRNGWAAAASARRVYPTERLCTWHNGSVEVREL